MYEPETIAATAIIKIILIDFFMDWNDSLVELLISDIEFNKQVKFL